MKRTSSRLTRSVIEPNGIDVGEGDDKPKLIAKMKSRMQTIRHEVNSQKPILITWEVNDDGTLGRELRQLQGNEAFLETIRREADSDSLQTYSIAVHCLRRTVPSSLFDEDSILGDFLRVVRDMDQSGDRSLNIESYLPDTPAAQKLIKTLHLDSPLARQQLLREVTTMGIDWLSGEVAGGTNAASPATAESTSAISLGGPN